MLQVARLAPSLLREAANQVADFFLSQFTNDGGVMNRNGKSDLYYTVFGLEGLTALQHELPPRTQKFLESFGDGERLDFVHLCCLARSRRRNGGRCMLWVGGGWFTGLCLLPVHCLVCSQNGSTPREVSLETVQKWTRFEQNDPLFGPFLTTLHEGRNRFEGPKNGPILRKMNKK